MKGIISLLFWRDWRMGREVISEATPGGALLNLGSPVQDMDLQEKIQQRTRRGWRGWSISCENRLRELRLLRDDPINVPKYLMGGNEAQTHTWNSIWAQEKPFLTLRLVTLWNRLPREVVPSPAVGMFRPQLDSPGQAALSDPAAAGGLGCLIPFSLNNVSSKWGCLGN